jgi:hypothetical protein
MSEHMRAEGRPKLEQLELNRETIQDLNEGDAADAQGGMWAECLTQKCTKDLFCPTQAGYSCGATCVGCPTGL